MWMSADLKWSMSKSSWSRSNAQCIIGCWIYALLLILLPPHRLDTFHLSLWFSFFGVLFFLASTYTNIPYDALRLNWPTTTTIAHVCVSYGVYLMDLVLSWLYCSLWCWRTALTLPPSVKMWCNRASPTLEWTSRVVCLLLHLLRFIWKFGVVFEKCDWTVFIECVLSYSVVEATKWTLAWPVGLSYLVYRFSLKIATLNDALLVCFLNVCTAGV